MIKIVPSGDYVQLKYVDTLGEYVQEELKSDSDAIECSYDSNDKCYLKFGRMTFEYFDPTDFEIDGVAVTSAADFITKLTALFSSSPGGASGIDSVLAVGQLLTADRTIDLNGHDFYIAQNGDNLFAVDLDGAGSWLYSHFTPGGQGLNEGALSVLANEFGVDALFDSSFNAGAKEARISAHAEETTALLDYLADIHTFRGVLNLPTQSAPASPNDGDIWREDNTNTGLKIRINGVIKTIVVA